MAAPRVGPHFFVERADPGAATATLHGAEAHHLGVVLRAQPGDPVSLSDGAGASWQGTVAAVAADAVTVALQAPRHAPAPRPRLTVVHALPKGRKLDAVVQRLVEVGVDRIVPVRSARSQMRLSGEAGGRAVARWRAVALAAAKQSRRVWLPQVAPVGTWACAFEGGVGGVCCWEEAATPLRETLLDAEAAELVVAIGPEGGLTAEEVVATGLPAVSLGATILRTETAALVASSILLYRVGRLG